ncbi:carboxypeptidase-like regulatory domain-containing protein [Dyadobacter sp. CY261]|uniref:carboxypeptidase-like regulatory domain-containing protein n=1 Tax=Dyadobacter sp. CY261 TaxID=2907203 RepID=UPI001F218EA2|nr:carboxypeptidase-like regulatory domain-containing protein [Dyadobacter sp. CY261]MCF0074949.1 carboxypeptidase-like regulatory domain-containing protein [Dyadobacter sp. CY261]
MNPRRFLIFTFSLLLFRVFWGYGQSVKITGHVHADDGSALSGASVTLRVPSIGTVTRPDGSFSLSPIPDGRFTLSVSSIGYIGQSKEFVAKSGKDLVFNFIQRFFTMARVETPDGDEFMIVGGVNNPSTLYLLTAGTLTEGAVTSVGNGIETTSWSRWFKNGYYYKRTNGKFAKYKYENKALTTVAEIPVTGNSVTYTWLDDKTLMLENASPTGTDPILSYSIINVEAMAVTKSGTISGQAIGKTDNDLSVGSLVLRNNKLYIGFSIFNANWNASDTAYLAAVDYPALDKVRIFKDTRSTYPGAAGK